MMDDDIETRDHHVLHLYFFLSPPALKYEATLVSFYVHFQAGAIASVVIGSK
jgi:hypothetical protein